MSKHAPHYQSHLHQVGLTIGWSLLLNVGIVAAALRYDRVAFYTHALSGWLLVMLTYFFILWLLVPYGFNVNNPSDWKLYAHGVVGTMLLGFSIIIAVFGTYLRYLQQGGKTDIARLKFLRNIHRFFGYFLALLYKFVNIYSWRGNFDTAVSLLVWEIFWIILYVMVKVMMPKMQRKVYDKQTSKFLCAEVTSLKEITSVTDKFVVFADYVYDARELEKNHPGGNKVIELVKGREVDRFIYGMYSAELYPQLAAYSHSMYSLQLIGNPIAKIVYPPTYLGFQFDVSHAKVKYMDCIAEKTQIYHIGVVQKYKHFKYLGYRDIRQLGQYYSFSTLDGVTRIYSTVNFLSVPNVNRMNEILTTRRETLQFSRSSQQRKPSEAEMVRLAKNKNNIQEKLIKKQDRSEEQEEYVPLMIKVYEDGKMTGYLKRGGFLDIDIKISIPRGRGIQLENTKPGKIIVVTGGTGLFPFSDTIDLMFKSQVIREGHKISDQLLLGDPILKQRPFDKYNFVFLIAVAEAEDIHPTTFDQLVGLSRDESRFKITLRVSKNADKLKSVVSKISFTKDYFTKRVVSEAGAKDFSRVWISGPPRMNCDTASVLIENGFTMDQFLLI